MDSTSVMKDAVLRLRPYEYVHVMDRNTCDVFVVEGPCCVALPGHHVPLHAAPQPHITIPRAHYCTVSRAVRLHQRPFALQPGECAAAIRPLPVIGRREGLVVRALVEYGPKASRRAAGDRWIVTGPRAYRPRAEEVVERRATPIVLRIGEILRLRARADFADAAAGVVRRCGDVWSVSARGLHFPPPQAVVVAVVAARALRKDCALHIRADSSFVDGVFDNISRAPGDEWLVTHCDTALYTPTEHETIVAEVPLTIVRRQQYAVVVRGAGRELRAGPCAFFLAPGEVLHGGSVQNAFLLGADEAMLVEARGQFVDADGVARDPAARWLVHGPRSYIPPLEVRVVEARKAMRLSDNEGVYVRNVRTGEVRAEFGRALMLSADEELWEKPMDPLVRRMLHANRFSAFDEVGGYDQSCPSASEMAMTETDQDTGTADSTATTESETETNPFRTASPPYAVVSCNVPPNALVQLYDYSTRTSRVVAGPTAVFLAPHEEFTTVTLSSGRPKNAGCVHSLCLFLGPDFMADVIEVETLEHARLQLVLAYNWEFDTSDRKHTETIAFTVQDFVSVACQTLANRIRAVISGIPFDDFHRNSSSLIRQAIFHTDESGTTEMRGDCLYFPSCGLVITSVDVRSVEPVEVKTREALTKSVQLAVEIITTSQENEASHQAMLLEQEAKGALELQLIRDMAAAEETRVRLLDVVAGNTAIELVGSSRAQAQAECDARIAEAQSELDVTPTRCTAQEVMAEAELDVMRKRLTLEFEHRQVMNALTVAKAKALADIQASKFEKIFESLGRGTLEAIARAGPELKAKLLQALGLKGFLVTDGTAPLNLLNMADQIVQRHE